MKVGETYTGEELLKLCEAGDDDRFYAVVGKKASVIVEDVGNDNYEIIEIVKQREENATYKGHHISFKRVKDVDGNGALQYFIDGRWHGTVNTKVEAVTRAEVRIDTL